MSRNLETLNHMRIIMELLIVDVLVLGISKHKE
jgi:hypothetical protein